jgi:hypothetical protein
MEEVAKRHPGALTARTPDGSLAHAAASAGHINILSILNRWPIAAPKKISVHCLACKQRREMTRRIFMSRSMNDA